MDEGLRLPAVRTSSSAREGNMRRQVARFVLRSVSALGLGIWGGGCDSDGDGTDNGATGIAWLKLPGPGDVPAS